MFSHDMAQILSRDIKLIAGITKGAPCIPKRLKVSTAFTGTLNFHQTGNFFEGNSESSLAFLGLNSRLLMCLCATFFEVLVEKF